MAIFNDQLNRIADLYIRMYSDRYTGLGPDYDPELACPLSEEEQEEFKMEVTDIFEEHGPTGMSDISTKLQSELTTFLQQEVFPEISDNIGQEHFPKSFGIFLKVVAQAMFNLNTMLQDLPADNAFSKLLYEFCVDKIYNEYGDALLSVVFEELGNMRQHDSVLAHDLMYYLKEIVKHFSSFDDAIWRQPYRAKVFAHNVEYASTLQVNNNTFIDRAFQRADAEESLANSFNLGGISNIEAIRRAAIDAFLEVHSETEDPEVFFELFEQTENHEIFQNLLRFYGHSGDWSDMSHKLKDNILDTGTEMRSRFIAPNNIWTMALLEQAVREAASYEKAVYDRLCPNEQNIEGLRALLISAFKSNFTLMFPRVVGRPKPEEFFANLVEYVVAKEEGEVIFLDPTLEDWRLEMLEHINVLIPHIHNKHLFIEQVESWIRVYNREQGRKRNESFYRFVMMRNVRGYLSPGVREQLSHEVSTRYADLQDLVKKGKVVEVYSNTTLVGSEESSLTSLVEDSKTLFVVSVPHFAGARKSVYIRMTGLQMELLNTLIVWKELTLKNLYDAFIRDDSVEPYEASTAGVNDVVRSLVSKEMIKKTPDVPSYDANHVISINGGLVFNMPYVEIDPPLQGVVGISTDTRYIVDRAICEFLQVENETTTFSLYPVILSTVVVSQSVIQARMNLLKKRGFLLRSDEEPHLISYVAP